jgi:uncharacterized protein YaaN involved in tellurite resistance
MYMGNLVSQLLDVVLYFASQSQESSQSRVRCTNDRILLEIRLLDYEQFNQILIASTPSIAIVAHRNSEFIWALPNTGKF